MLTANKNSTSPSNTMKKTTLMRMTISMKKTISMKMRLDMMPSYTLSVPGSMTTCTASVTKKYLVS